MPSAATPLFDAAGMSQLGKPNAPAIAETINVNMLYVFKQK
jgi:hypothetical protein